MGAAKKEETTAAAMYREVVRATLAEVASVGAGSHLASYDDGYGLSILVDLDVPEISGWTAEAERIAKIPTPPFRKGWDAAWSEARRTVNAFIKRHNAEVR